MTKAKKKVVLFPEIGRMKFFLSLTRPHSGVCIRIYIFNIKKQTNKQKKKNIKKAKETKEEKIISLENWFKKNKFAVARMNIFLVTHIFGNMNIVLSFFFFLFFFWPNVPLI